MKVVVALGSNLGDSDSLLNQAIAEIKNFCQVNKVSSYIKTKPVGGPEQPDYLNAVLIAESDLQSEEFLKNLQETLSNTRQVQTEKNPSHF